MRIAMARVPFVKPPQLVALAVVIAALLVALSVTRRLSPLRLLCYVPSLVAVTLSALFDLPSGSTIVWLLAVVALAASRVRVYSSSAQSI